MAVEAFILPFVMLHDRHDRLELIDFATLRIDCITRTSKAQSVTNILLCLEFHRSGVPNIGVRNFRARLGLPDS